MDRTKLFVENFLVYGLGGIISKLVPLIMIPIVTRLMPDTFYFGLNDLSTTVVSFGSALAIMGMYDAMFRMFFEKDDEEYKKDICSSALVVTIITSLIIFTLLIIFRRPFSDFVFSNEKFGNLLLLTAISILIGSTNSIVAAPTRMQNKRVIYLITNILSPLLSYSIALPLLIKGYFVIALPLASVVSAFSLEVIFWVLNRGWFKFRRVKWDLIKEMLVIAVPLLPNFLIYWIFNSCDRLFIAKMMGNQYTGIYAVGAKVGQFSQLIYIAFAGGWQYFAFSTMKDKDQVKMASNIFEYLGITSFVAGMIMTLLSRPIFELFFTGDYVKGYTVAPYLFLAPLLQMLFQVAGTQFIVEKRTWPNMLILFSGAIINVILNFKLIPVLGIEGSALATLLGYAIADVVCVIVLTRMKLINISMKFIISALIFCGFLVTWRLVINNQAFNIIFLIAIFCTYLIFYKKDLNKIITGLKDKIGV